MDAYQQRKCGKNFPLGLCARASRCSTFLRSARSERPTSPAAPACVEETLLPRIEFSRSRSVSWCARQENRRGCSSSRSTLLATRHEADGVPLARRRRAPVGCGGTLQSGEARSRESAEGCVRWQPSEWGRGRGRRRRGDRPGDAQGKISRGGVAEVTGGNISC